MKNGPKTEEINPKGFFLLKRWRWIFLSSHPAALDKVSCRSSAVGGARCRPVGGKALPLLSRLAGGTPKALLFLHTSLCSALRALSICRKKTEG